jgi:hypothetical protein
MRIPLNKRFARAVEVAERCRRVVPVWSREACNHAMMRPQVSCGR